jgi:hypothetical protein
MGSIRLGTIFFADVVKPRDPPPVDRFALLLPAPFTRAPFHVSVGVDRPSSGVEVTACDPHENRIISISLRCGIAREITLVIR